MKSSPGRSPAHPVNEFLLQWHVTARCDQECGHCYMKGHPSYRRELARELSTDLCRRIIDNYDDTCRRLGLKKHINVTGGDPLLREDLFELLDHARRKGIGTGVLGNPNHVTPAVARKLKAAGIFGFQMSIDGLEETHDRLRGRKGLFRMTLRALRTLHRAGIRTEVSFTLSKANAGELLEVIRLASREAVSLFHFSRIVPGKGDEPDAVMLDPQEYRKLLLSVFVEYQWLKKKGCTTIFGSKDNLWQLLYHELGLLTSVPRTGEACGGCSIGLNSLAVLADGTVYPCRRLPVAVGCVPRDDFAGLLRDAPLHRKFRNVKNMKKCSRCRLRLVCRGCPAVAYAVSGDCFGPDPQCWRGEKI